ncbi:MAG: hypothetical protein VX464_20800 [Pseudomonadota bacterium]|nr:hypothetical protein [Pseudomonadota bacterium]
MGCDIHLVMERKVGDAWVAVDTFRSYHEQPGHTEDASRRRVWPAATSRNYRRFAALAGVRGPGPDPRGVPEDMSETARFLVEDWAEDGHSHTWLPVDEAAKVFRDTEYGELDEWARNYPASFYFDMDEKPEDHRLIIWFDN